MKMVKNAALILIAALILDCILVYASQQTVISININAGGSYTTSYKTKNSVGEQTYTNNFTNTPLTSPCPKCVIAVRFQKRDGTYTDRAVMMEQTVKANNTALWNVGDYRLKLWRSDATLLTTYTSGNWSY